MQDARLGAVSFLHRFGSSLNAHSTAFLPKPYRAADLVRTVREVLTVKPGT